MPPITLLNLQTLLRKIGRGVIFYAHDGTEAQTPVRWDGVSTLNLAHLADTEGEMKVTPNGRVEKLTLPEISGDAAYEADYVGEAPVIEAPVFAADPDLLDLLSPTGESSAGLERTEPVAERTIVIFPERLFKKPAVRGFGTLTYVTGGTFLLDGVALTAAQLTLLEHTFWGWRVYANRPGITFKGGAGNDAKLIEVVQFEVMMHPTMPNAHHLYTRGNPFAAGIEIDPGS
jgi:hypothetical protein